MPTNDAATTEHNASRLNMGGQYLPKAGTIGVKFSEVHVRMPSSTIATRRSRRSCLNVNAVDGAAPVRASRSRCKVARGKSPIAVDIIKFANAGDKKRR